MTLIIIYLFSLYLGMRWHYYTLKNTQGAYRIALPIFSILGGFATYSLVIYGFFIFKWYFILPLVIFIALGPILFLLPPKISLNSVQNNIVRAIKYNVPIGIYLILVSLFFWFKHFNFPKGWW